MEFIFDGGGRRSADVTTGIIAGWTGRNHAAVDAHIRELAELGVAPPSSIPLFYRVSASLFTTASRIETVGTDSSGEAEPLLFMSGDRLWLGLGSDHTDRKLESRSVALSKQICAKPVAPLLWPLAGLVDRLDNLELRSWTRQEGSSRWDIYQEGKLAEIRPLTDLATASPAADGEHKLTSGTIMMCGTLPVCDGKIRPSRFFRMELRDTVKDRAIEHSYETITLPIIS